MSRSWRVPAVDGGARAGFRSRSDFFLKNAIRFFLENRFAFEKEKSISDFFAEVFDRDRDRVLI
jgi:hypothetical protein